MKKRVDNQNIKIRLIKKSELAQAGKVFAQAFNLANVGKHWTIPGATKFMQYWFKRQPDLFFVAILQRRIVGGIVAGIKPWYDTNHLVEGKLFVDPSCQNQGLAGLLIRSLLDKGIKKYQVITFGGTADSTHKFPMSWYKKIGLSLSEWVQIEGDVKEILEKLSGNESD